MAYESYTSSSGGSKMPLLMSIGALVIALTALAIAIAAIVRVGATSSKIDTVYATMRDRISKLVRDINNVNELEYNVDVEQQKRLDILQGDGKK